MGNKVAFTLKITALAVGMVGLFYGADAGVFKYLADITIKFSLALTASLVIWAKYLIYALLLFAFGEVIQLLEESNQAKNTLDIRLFQIEGLLNEERLERKYKHNNTPQP